MPEDSRTASDHDLLIAIHGDVKTLKERVCGYVPEKCVEHSGQIGALGGRIETVEGSVKGLWNRLWWLVGLALAPTAAAVIYAALK